MLRSLWPLVWLTAGYFVLADLGLRWATLNGAASPVFPAAGLALGGLVLGGVRLWPAIVVGRLAAAFVESSALPVWADVAIACGNALAASAGALALRAAGFSRELARLRDVLLLVAVAVAHSAIAAGVGTAVLSFAAAVRSPAVALPLISWWTGNTSGVLLVAPLMFAWNSARQDHSWRWWGNLAGSTGLAGVMAWVIFGPGDAPLMRTFLMFPVLIWAAVACGVRGAALAMVPVAILSIWGTTQGYGPMADAAARADEPYRFLLLQQFLSVASATALILAVVADERRSQEALRESEALTRTIAENSTQGLAIMDARGFCTYANPAWLAMTGYTAEEIGSKPLHDLVHHHYPDGRPYPKEECPIDRALPEDSSVRAHEDVFFRKDGSSFAVSCAASPIFKDGRPVSTVVEIRDITAERAAEAARRQAEAERSGLLEREREARLEAERASRLKDEFLSTLSHELRTPVNAIAGWSQLLRQSTPAAADPAVDRGLVAIDRNARMQAQLVEDLLDMSRIVSGKLRLEFRTIDIQEVVTEAVAAVLPAAHARQVELRWTPGPALATRADPDRMQQVVWNLLSNAIKFTPPSGVVQVSLAAEQGHVELTVSDTGEGISPDFLPFVFDRFRQADASTTRTRGGLGLGLAIARSIVELHGGTIQARSAGPGLGATFVVRLPAGDG